jgi:hypothetical protein
VNKRYTQTETRQISDFDQVSIKGNTCSAQVLITQGQQEGLTIEAPPEYLDRLRSEVKDRKLTVRLQDSWLQELEDALATCLNRPHILYRLTVRQLTYLEVQCAYIVHSSRIETPHLHAKLNGTGDFKLDWLWAETLEVHHSGSGTMRISGQVEEQTVVLNGVGSYLAPRLDSQRALVRISGTGLARIQVSQTLDARLRGVGILEYSGHPTVSKRISGPGQVLHIADVGKGVA